MAEWAEHKVTKLARMWCVERCTCREIADALDVPITSVQGKLRRLKLTGKGGRVSDSWSKQDLDFLEYAWCTLGLTAGRISTEFRGRYSRSAVIGKISRLGLVKPGKAPRPGKPKQKHARVSVGAIVRNRQRAEEDRARCLEELAVPVPDPGDAGPQALGYDDPWPADRCRWPVGEPRDRENFRFCGQAVVGHKYSFCEQHARRMWRRA